MWDDAVGGTVRWDALEVVAPTAADVVEEGQRWMVEVEEVAGAARVADVVAVGEGVVDEIAEGVEGDVVVAAGVADHWYLASKQQVVRGLGTCQNKYRRERGATNALC